MFALNILVVWMTVRGRWKDKQGREDLEKNDLCIPFIRFIFSLKNVLDVGLVLLPHLHLVVFFYICDCAISDCKNISNNFKGDKKIWGFI